MSENWWQNWGYRLLSCFLLSFQNKTREEAEKGTYQDAARCRARLMVSQCEAHCSGWTELKATIYSQPGNAQSDGRGVRTRWETRGEGRFEGRGGKNLCANMCLAEIKKLLKVDFQKRNSSPFKHLKVIAALIAWIKSSSLVAVSSRRILQLQDVFFETSYIGILKSCRLILDFLKQ